MKPGRELDALVAEKVMGFKPCSDPIGKCDAAHMSPPLCWDGSELKPYSTNISAAWEVVEKVSLLGWERALGKTRDGEWCTLYHDLLDSDHRCDFSTRGESAPHAICLAALNAVGVEVQE